MLQKLQLALWLALALPLAAQQAAQENSAGAQPVGELTAWDASVHGSVTLDGSGGTEVLSGSQIQAGSSAARLHLTRGGELTICPRSSAAISSADDSKGLLIGINTGAIVLDTTPGSYADTVVTPDLRLQLPGPGRFHFALGSAANGDTCLQALRGDEAGIIVSESMGSGVYQLRPSDAILFREGKISEAIANTAPCGCPEMPEAASISLPKDFAAAASPQPATAAPQSGTVSPQSHLELDAPLSFQGSAEAQQMPPLLMTVRSVDHSDLALTMHPLPLKTEKSAKKRGFLGRLLHKIFP